jgi:hypothetical protein
MNDNRTTTHLSFQELEEETEKLLDLDETDLLAIIQKLRDAHHKKNAAHVRVLHCYRFTKGSYQMVKKESEYRKFFRKYTPEEPTIISLRRLSSLLFDDGQAVYKTFASVRDALKEIYYYPIIRRREVKVTYTPPKAFFKRVAYALAPEQIETIVEYDLLVDFAKTKEMRKAKRRKLDMERALSKTSTPPGLVPPASLKQEEHLNADSSEEAQKASSSISSEGGSEILSSSFSYHDDNNKRKKEEEKKEEV